MESYWTRTLQRRLSRRRAVTAAASGVFGGAFLVACGGDDDSSSPTAGTGATGGAAPTGSTGATGTTGATGATSSLLHIPADTSSEATKGGIFKSFLGFANETFDQVTGNFATQYHTDHVYSRLVRFKAGSLEQPPEGEIEPDVATGWEMAPDGLTWTFNLRQGMKFDSRPPTNGRDLGVDDIRNSWERFAELSTSRSQLVNAVTPDAPVTEVSFPDESTAVFKLAFPFGAFLRSIGYSWHFTVMPVEAADQGDATHFDVKQEMRGTGPWMLTSYTPSVGWEYRKNPDWFDADRLPYLDGINYPLISEQATQEAQFKAGNIWALPAPNADLVLSLKQENPEVLMRAVSPFIGNGSHNLVGFSKREDSIWFTDVRMRRAVSMLLDRDGWIDAFWNVSGFEREGVPIESGWHSHIPTSWGTLWLDPKAGELGDASKYFEFNPDEAAKLLEAAGQMGAEHQYTYHGSGGFGGQTLIRQNEVITEMLQTGGHFKLNIVTPDYVPDFRPNYLWSQGDFPGIVGNHPLGSWPDWDLALWSGYTPGSRNDWVRVELPRAHELMVQHRRESDEDVKYDLMVEWQKELADQMWVIPHPGQASTFALEQPWLGNAGFFQSWVGGGGAATGGAAAEREIHLWYDRAKDPNA